MSAELPYAHGGPPLCARLRLEPADFDVEEVLGFEPSGHGEHAFLRIEKTGANTDWVARELARAAGVAPAAVGYAGLKDRHAVARQAFTVHLPGRDGPDWSALDVAGVAVLEATRHDRKLKRGAHRGNRFRIRLRGASGDRDAAASRLEAIRARGVPNYFGEQRFGRGGANLALAEALFAGRRLPRFQHGVALSAARSALFNAALATRVADRSWDRPLDGEVWMLDGARAIFGPEPIDEVLERRCAALEIHPTGPLWGRGELRSTGAVRRLEDAAAAAHAAFAAGLAAADLRQERRALRLRGGGLAHAWDGDTLECAFELGAGAFATALLRELCRWSDRDE
ncbi:MAG TPA: tRNA pseudouridine(13) synthase TruD [Dokdonella sp.]